MTRPKGKTIAATAVLLLLAVCLWPLDVFTHGFFCDEVARERIEAQDITLYQDLLDTPFEQAFAPQSGKFAGFEVNMANIPAEQGTLVLTLTDAAGRQLAQKEVPFADLKEKQWYQVYMGASLRVGQTYTVRLSVYGCQHAPALQVVDPAYLPQENVQGDLLIGYAYKAPTFTFHEKVLLLLGLAGLWLAAVLAPALPQRGQYARLGGVFLVLSVVLAWNYMSNIMDNKNPEFQTLQKDSEALVVSMFQSQHDGVQLPVSGLGRYTTTEGDLVAMAKTPFVPVTDDNWYEGYARRSPMLAFHNNAYTQAVCVPGNQIRFANGETYTITKAEANGTYLNVTLDAPGALNSAKHGPLIDVEFLDAAGQPLPKGTVVGYGSQYGLQGKVMRVLARGMTYETTVDRFHLLCSLLCAGTFVLIVFLLAKRYDWLMAGCFYVVFWCSPMVVNHASNLYWVMFTWFWPMAVGLACAIWGRRRNVRLACYALAFATILLKSLCGYEYLTAVMLGMIAFLLADLVQAALQKRWDRAKRLFGTIFLLGVCALLGFAVAIGIHATMRGDGDLVAGIRSIIEHDVLRRVGGGEMGDFAPIYWESLNASSWETLLRYFNMWVQILPGLPGNFFPLMSALPIAVFARQYHHGRLSVRDVLLYITLFATSASWMVLAKAHSYIHVNMAYVLWDFGFIQICLYILLKELLDRPAPAAHGKRDGRR